MESKTRSAIRTRPATTIVRGGGVATADGHRRGQGDLSQRAATAECVNALARNAGCNGSWSAVAEMKAVALWYALVHNLMRAVTLRAAAAQLVVSGVESDETSKRHKLGSLRTRPALPPDGYRACKAISLDIRLSTTLAVS